MMLKCEKCGYLWRTKSKLMNVSCPSCLRKVGVKDHGVGEETVH